MRYSLRMLLILLAVLPPLLAAVCFVMQHAVTWGLTDGETWWCLGVGLYFATVVVIIAWWPGKRPAADQAEE